jgi:hypothetical protein
LARKNGLGRQVVAGAVGVGIGLVLGNRLVKTYDWRTEWFVPAPLPTVYEALTSRSAVRQWWPSMQLVDEGGGDELWAGSRVDFSVQQAPEVARLAPPFVIHCVYTDVEPERRLREVGRHRRSHRSTRDPVRRGPGRYPRDVHLVRQGDQPRPQPARLRRRAGIPSQPRHRHERRRRRAAPLLRKAGEIPDGVMHLTTGLSLRL